MVPRKMIGSFAWMCGYRRESGEAPEVGIGRCVRHGWNSKVSRQGSVRRGCSRPD